MLLGGTGCQFDSAGVDYGADSPDAGVAEPDAEPTGVDPPPTMPDPTCDQGACLCEPPLADCGPAGCVDLDTDRNHCGDCGRKCRADEVCVEDGCARFRVRASCEDCGDEEVCGVHFDGSDRIICIEDDD